MQTLPRFRLLKPLLTFLVIGVGAVWLLNTLTSGNPLWWFPVQPVYVPDQIVVHNAGATDILARGTQPFLVVSAGLDATLADFRSRALVDIGLSDQTLAEYETTALVVDVHYRNPVRFNLPIRLERINRLLIPIEGRHAGRGYVFIGTDGRWRAGALQVADIAPLERALDELGYLAPSTPHEE